MKTVCLAVALTLALFTKASVPQTTFTEHEKRDDDPSWLKGERLHGEDIIPLRVGLTQNNLDQGHEMLMDVSDPSSKNYGHYYSADEITDIFAPNEETVEAVRSWLVGKISRRRISLSTNKQWLQLDATVSEIEELFNSTYHEYYHHQNGAVAIGCDAYHVPQHLTAHIDYITPGVKSVTTMPSSKLQKRQIKPRVRPAPFSVDFAKQNCSRAITPGCIRKLYNISGTVTKQAGNSLGIFESGDFLNQKDLNRFFTRFYNEIPNGTYPTVRRVDGAPDPAEKARLHDYGPGLESAIDFMAAYPLVYPDDLVLYQVDDFHYEIHYGFAYGTRDGIFNTFLDAIDGSYCTRKAFGITGDSPDTDPTYPDPAKGGYKGQLQCGKFNATKVISLSYAAPEAFFPVNYLRRQCSEYMKLGMQGVTILFASGDNGVAPESPLSPKKLRCLGPNKDKFGPLNPSTCPYVTAVGGTVLVKDIADPSPEEADDISGGGFSNLFPPAEYQKATIENYFREHNPPYPHYTTKNSRTPPKDAGKGLYNRAGRGIPDLAASSEGLPIYNAGNFHLAGGTSMATPIVAGIITRINGARLAAGKSPVGFLNPTLYQNPHVLNDITGGNNPGCGTKGFKAVPGWDPVTGLGTPNTGKMMDLFLSLP